MSSGEACVVFAQDKSMPSNMSVETPRTGPMELTSPVGRISEGPANLCVVISWIIRKVGRCTTISLILAQFSWMTAFPCTLITSGLSHVSPRGTSLARTSNTYRIHSDSAHRSASTARVLEQARMASGTSVDLYDGGQCEGEVAKKQ